MNNKPITFYPTKEVIEMLCPIVNISYDALLNDDRRRPLPDKRKLIWRILFDIFKLTHEGIGFYVKRERSTITTGLTYILNLISTEPELKNQFTTIFLINQFCRLKLP